MRTGRLTRPLPSSPCIYRGIVREGLSGKLESMDLWRSQNRFSMCSTSPSWLTFLPPNISMLNSTLLKHVAIQSDKWKTGQGFGAAQNLRETLVRIGTVTLVTGIGRVLLFWWMNLCNPLLMLVPFWSLRVTSAIFDIFGSNTPKLGYKWNQKARDTVRNMLPFAT